MLRALRRLPLRPPPLLLPQLLVPLQYRLRHLLLPIDDEEGFISDLYHYKTLYIRAKSIRRIMV